MAGYEPMPFHFFGIKYTPEEVEEHETTNFDKAENVDDFFFCFLKPYFLNEKNSTDQIL